MLLSITKRGFQISADISVCSLSSSGKYISYPNQQAEQANHKDEPRQKIGKILQSCAVNVLKHHQSWIHLSRIWQFDDTKYFFLPVLSDSRGDRGESDLRYREQGSPSAVERGRHERKHMCISFFFYSIWHICKTCVFQVVRNSPKPILLVCVMKENWYAGWHHN